MTCINLLIHDKALLHEQTFLYFVVDTYIKIDEVAIQALNIN